MKRPFRSSRYSSFTLVELLVVLGIITILASLLLMAVNGAIKMALRAKAATMANQIQGACMTYYNDYGIYPLPTNAASQTQFQYGATSTDTSNWKNLIWALCGNINAYSPTTAQTPTVSNTRSIAYLSLNIASIDTNGVPLNPIPPDTTNLYFNIMLDGAYTGILTNVPVFSAGTLTTNNMSGGVYVWASCNTTSNVSNYSWWVHAP
jgi:type II secretory pathway pseudopilin PulG